MVIGVAAGSYASSPVFSPSKMLDKLAIGLGTPATLRLAAAI